MSGKKCKNDEICVKVEICLEDMIVVKYTNSDNKTFQGVLLDSTNRYYIFIIILLFGNFLVYDFWTPPPLLSILYIDLM